MQYALTRLGCGDAFVARRGMGVHPSIGSVACGKEDKREGGIERRHEMTPRRPSMPQKGPDLVGCSRHVRHGCWSSMKRVHGISNLISLQSPHTLCVCHLILLQQVGVLLSPQCGALRSGSDGGHASGAGIGFQYPPLLQGVLGKSI